MRYCPPRLAFPFQFSFFPSCSLRVTPAPPFSLPSSSRLRLLLLLLLLGLSPRLLLVVRAQPTITVSLSRLLTTSLSLFPCVSTQQPLVASLSFQLRFAALLADQPLNLRPINLDKLNGQGGRGRPAFDARVNREFPSSPPPPPPSPRINTHTRTVATFRSSQTTATLGRSSARSPFSGPDESRSNPENCRYKMLICIARS